MKYLKRMFNDLKSRILDNPKSSIAGVLAIVAYLASVFGFAIDPGTLAFIASMLLGLVGLFKKD